MRLPLGGETHRPPASPSPSSIYPCVIWLCRASRRSIFFHEASPRSARDPGGDLAHSLPSISLLAFFSKTGRAFSKISKSLFFGLPEPSPLARLCPRQVSLLFSATTEASDCQEKKEFRGCPPSADSCVLQSVRTYICTRRVGTRSNFFRSLGDFSPGTQPKRRGDLRPVQLSNSPGRIAE